MAGADRRSDRADIASAYDAHTFQIFGAYVNLTQVIALSLAVFLTIGTTAFLRFTAVGTAMRALANDREISATLGVPVRRVEAVAWFGSGIVCGAVGLLFRLAHDAQLHDADLPRHLLSRGGADRPAGIAVGP